MVELKSFDSFLNEAVTPEEEKDLLKKGQEVTSIVSDIVSHQNKITELYDKLKELMKDNEVLAPLVKSVELAADRSKEDSAGAKEIEKKIEKTKKDYVPRKGSAAEHLINYLKDKGASTEHKAQEFMAHKSGGDGKNGDGFNRATITSTLEFLVDKGILDKVSKFNPESKRTAWFYIFKNKY